MTLVGRRRAAGRCCLTTEIAFLPL